MNGSVRRLGVGIALAATALTTAVPAQAQHWRGGYRGHHRGGGDVAAGAILGGIVGLGIGAAIAGSRNDRIYDQGYHERGYARGYYTPPPPRVVERGYYNSYRNYAPRCYDQWRFDPYYGEQIRVRVCE